MDDERQVVYASAIVPIFFCCTKIKSVLFQPDEKKATHRPLKVRVGFHLRGLVNSKRTVTFGF